MSPAESTEKIISKLLLSQAKHLLAILDLQESRGYVRGSDVARILRESKSNAFVHLKELASTGYVVEDENHIYGLTAFGKEIASALRTRRGILQTFFFNVLKRPRIEAESEIDHLILNLSAESCNRLLEFLQNAESNKHEGNVTCSECIFKGVTNSDVKPCRYAHAGCEKMKSS